MNSSLMVNVLAVTSKYLKFGDGLERLLRDINYRSLSS